MNRIVLYLIAAIVLSSGPARATLYQYTDPDGVLSYTDQIDSIPESSRATVKKIEESSLPQLLTLPDQTDLPETTGDPATPPPSRREWPVRTILAAVLTAGLAWLAFRMGGGSVLMKITGRLMITASLGAAVYLIFAFGGFQNAPLSPSEPPDGPAFKRLSPIGRTQETTNAFQDRLTDEQEKLDEVAPDPEEPPSPFHPPVFRP